ncbi:MAG: potassium-transporting ATPase subunit F [Armatimonadia bacterium]
MNPLYLITGLLALALFVYLAAALLKPEWFG